MLHDYQLSILEPKALAARGCITPIPKTPQLYPCAANRTKDEPKAAPVVQSKGEPRETPHHGDTPRGVDTIDILNRLAVVDTNIDALLGWGLVPHLQDGELVIGGIEDMGPEDRAGLERWFAHKGPGGEPRRERVIRALKTGRRCAA